jgi:hypothetical protein
MGETLRKAVYAAIDDSVTRQGRGLAVLIPFSGDEG